MNDVGFAGGAELARMGFFGQFDCSLDTLGSHNYIISYLVAKDFTQLLLQEIIASRHDKNHNMFT